MNTQGEHVPRVTVITLNWNGRDETLECLASLKKLDYSNYDIVVVDNGSTDGSVPAFRARHRGITIIDNGRNLGYAEGFNGGLRYAYEHGAEYFLILNNDTVIDPEALSELVNAAELDERIGFVSGKVYCHSRPNVLQTAGRYNHPILLAGGHVGRGEADSGQFDKIRDYDFIDDVFLLVRRKVYEAVGGYDPLFFLYYEETDWCARVRRAGFRIVYTPAAKIWHKGMLGNPVTPLSPKRVFYLQRYEIPFMWRNASPEQWAAYLRHLIFGLPGRILRYTKHGRFATMFAYLKGVSCGIAGLWLDRRKARPSGRPGH